jgi:glycosyltransferase involved in cell wall biosynthesis
MDGHTLKTGLATIMMPAYNAERFIVEAIESVLAQTYPDWELLVVDDGSTDRTAELVSGFDDPRIRMIRQQNGGESVARNTALENTRGEFLAFLDSDDQYLPNHLEETVQYLLQHPDRDAVYTDGYHCDSQGNRLQTLSSRRRGPFEGRIFEEVVRASDVFGPPISVVVRSETVLSNQITFDPQIVIGPDWDFFIRLANVADFGYLDHQTCLYRVHDTNITFQVSGGKRSAYLAVCREKAIKMENFHQLSVKTQYAVFYDLLVNLLQGHPNQQSSITDWPQFQRLPVADQARLLRLMASRAMITGGEHEHILSWLQNARELAPKDRKAAILTRLYLTSPKISQILLRARSMSRSNAAGNPLFGDLN